MVERRLVERLLANKIIGREDNWSKDNSLRGHLVKRIIGREDNWSKDNPLVPLVKGLGLGLRFCLGLGLVRRLKLRLRLPFIKTTGRV